MSVILTGQTEKKTGSKGGWGGQSAQVSLPGHRARQDEWEIHVGQGT